MDYEAVAKEQGWQPEDKYEGPPGTWKNAEEFVKRGQELAPILAANNKKLKAELDEIKSELSQIKASSAEFKKIADQAIERSQKERDAAIAALQKERAQAISDGDGAKVVEAESKIEKLKAERETKTDPQQVWNAEAAKWAKANSWYVPGSKDYDEERRIYADGISDIVMGELPHLRQDPTGYFRELTRRVEERFSEQNPNRSKSTVEQGGNKGKTTNGKSFDALPQAAKDGFAHMKRLIPALTEEEYVSKYAWE